MTLALLLTAVGGAWAEEKMVTINSSTMSSGAVTATGFYKVSDKIYVGSNPATIITSEGVITKLVIKKGNIYGSYFTEANVGVTPGTITYGSNEITVTDINAESVTLSRKGDNNWSPSSVDVYYGAAGPEVTINEAKTEASFKMPQYDVTATYTLKRDLSVETQVTVGDDHSAQPRYRVQKQGDTFQPVGMDQAQVMALFHVHDQIENQDLAPVQDYTVQIYAVDAQGQPTGTAMTFSNFTYAPGKYVVKAQGQGNYVGQTTESNVFTLYQGYEVTIPAQEFITYYKDEPLYVEDEAAELYTISSVTDTEAVLSEKSDAMPSNTPMLVYNKSNETKTILLIPCAEPDMALTVAPEFKGTLEATEIPASSETADYYVCTGNAFVWVKSAGTIGANKCWLEISNQPESARRKARSIVYGDGTTGIDASLVNSEERTVNGDVYDLNGRKVQNPTKKGVYIQNGRKVVIK